MLENNGEIKVTVQDRTVLTVLTAVKLELILIKEDGI